MVREGRGDWGVGKQAGVQGGAGVQGSQHRCKERC